MSFSLKVVDGDIATIGSTTNIVYGVEKLKQDISIWLRERYQSDRFHLAYGSILDGFIGDVIDDSTAYMVQAEVQRVLQNYQSLQYRLLKEHPERLSADEILVAILDIRTRVNYDTVEVTIRFSTGSRDVEQMSVAIQ
ncbi:baseplate wedge protein [Gordonia phage RedWattleHog]|uniref:Baseplate wedge protein n=1 Tax=Gordonia phage Stormageddon TaxID=2656541 RepID=A0A649VTM5_9CAUD|nr:baseplate protein [Gordonia phage Stormageddon]QGJ94913.1 baseplate wedge protein [Gordonia phage Stormageddon]QLF83557.1 baseplate wedge protein [Gordonia phage RedWattleHog]